MRKEVIGPCTLYLADCRDAMKEIDKVDCVIADPPYGVGLGVETDPRSNGHGLGKKPYRSNADSFEEFLSIVVPTIEHSLMLAKRGAIFCGHNIVHMPKPSAIGGIYLPSGAGRNPWGFSCISPIWFYGSAPNMHKGARPTALWSTECAERNGHPCPKPLRWMEWLVGLASLPGETILDPFAGSGTTGVACTKLGRRFIGIEIDPHYFSIMCHRIEQAVSQPDLFIPQPKPAEQLSLGLTA